jgi:hypothetical protein
MKEPIMRKHGKRGGPMSWKPWTPQEARMAGQTELVAGRSVDPKLKAARAEKNALRREKRRRKRLGVFINIAETTAAPGGNPDNSRKGKNDAKIL